MEQVDVEIREIMETLRLRLILDAEVHKKRVAIKAWIQKPDSTKL